MPAVDAIPDAWPALMRPEVARAYCGDLSESTFNSCCPVRPRDLGARVVVYAKVDLDAWIASLPVRLRQAQSRAKDAVQGPQEPAQAHPGPPAGDGAEERRAAALAKVQARGKVKCRKSGSKSATSSDSRAPAAA